MGGRGTRKKFESEGKGGGEQKRMKRLSRKKGRGYGKNLVKIVRGEKDLADFGSSAQKEGGRQPQPEDGKRPLTKTASQVAFGNSVKTIAELCTAEKEREVGILTPLERKCSWRSRSEKDVKRQTFGGGVGPQKRGGGGKGALIANPLIRGVITEEEESIFP